MSDETTTTTTATTETTHAQPSVAWLPGSDEAMAGYVQTKGWQGPADAVESYRNIEKVLGADRAGRTVVLPAADDAPEWSQVYDKLGRPKGPDGYELKVPDGADPEFAKIAATKMHELGLTQKQGAALAAWWNEQAGGASAAQQAAEQAALEAEHRQLEKDWGTGPDALLRRELARRAATSLGLDEASITALEKVAGFSKTMKAFAKMGDLLREHGAEGINEPGSFGMTPEGARARRSQLMADKDFRTRAMNANSSEWAEMQRLDKIIASVNQ